MDGAQQSSMHACPPGGTQKNPLFLQQLRVRLLTQRRLGQSPALPLLKPRCPPGSASADQIGERQCVPAPAAD